MTKAPAFNPLSSGADHRRQVRSFVLRGGRLTAAQQRALDQLWPRWGLEPTQLSQPGSIFEPSRPLVLDIGFGNGESLVHMAALAPETGFVGVEVYPPGIGAALNRISEAGLENARLVCADASELLAAIPADSLAGVRVYFPDPWPKKRHHKRRLVQQAFLADVVRVLGNEGQLHLATDWEPYAEHMCEALAPFASELVNVSDDPPYSPRPPWRPQTKFERRGLRLGHRVFDLVLTRSRTAAP